MSKPSKITPQVISQVNEGDSAFPPGDTEKLETLTAGSVGERLRSAGIPLTLQRLAIAQILLTEPIHLSADQVLSKAKKIMTEVSRATVYNILKLFKEKGLIREINVGSGHIIYDSNMTHHYHILNVDTGEMMDIPTGDLEVVGSTDLPKGVELDEVDVILRVHSI